MRKTRYIFVIGGVMSGVGKGIATGFEAFVSIFTRLPVMITDAAAGEPYILLSAYLVLTVSFAFVGRMLGRRIVGR